MSRIRSIGLVSALVLGLGCAATGDEDVDYRDAPAYPGNGDIVIAVGGTTAAASGGILIYDIQNGFVYEGSQSPENKILNVYDGEILDADFEQVFCTFEGDELVDAQTGEVIYRSEGMVVFDGDGSLDYHLKKKSIYDGAPQDENLIATASEEISRANDTRKLLVTALATAECGAPELPREGELSAGG